MPEPRKTRPPRRWSGGNAQRHRLDEPDSSGLVIEFFENYCYYTRMIDLTSKQRKELEKASHTLEPVVIVGQNGVSESLLKMVSQCLDVHELIKVKFNDFKDEKRELTENICNATDATLVRIIGNIAILFKRQEDPAKRKIKIKFD